MIYFQSDPIFSGSHVTIISLATIYVFVKDVLPKFVASKNGNGNGRYDAAQAALRQKEMREVFSEVMDDKLVPWLKQIAENTKR